MLPYLNCTGDEVHKQTDLNKMWAKKHKQTKVILGGWRNPTLGQSQQGIKTKLLRVLLGTLLDFSLKLLLNTSLIWIISGISLLTKWKVVLWQNLKYTSNFFFLIFQRFIIFLETGFLILTVVSNNTSFTNIYLRPNTSLVLDQIPKLITLVHGILQARILEWVAIPFFRGSSQLREGTWSLTL